MPATIAQRLSLPDRGGRSPIERLREHLRDRRLLIILDNFEQVIDAAPLVTELLADAPGLGILATSREALRVYGEREYPVPPLAVPDPRAVPEIGLASQFGAVALFLERARAVMPSFGLTDDNLAAVVEICYRLDGLPLAIELAAARVKLLSPAAMLGRLEHRLSLLGGGSRDLPARQQTLRGAIGWSYDLLDAPDRDLFACFSVFVGAVDLESVEAVCAAPDIDVLDGLSSLVDKSLVRRRDGSDGETRYRMLETIREYAAERLEEAGRTAELRTRHAAHFAARVRGSATAVAGGQRRHARPAGGRQRRAPGGHHLVRRTRATRRPPSAWPPACGGSGRCAATSPRAWSGPALPWRCRAARTRTCDSPPWTPPVAWPTGTTTRIAPVGTTRRRWTSGAGAVIRPPSRSRSTTCPSRMPSGTTRPRARRSSRKPSTCSSRWVTRSGSPGHGGRSPTSSTSGARTAWTGRETLPRLRSRRSRRSTTGS